MREGGREGARGRERHIGMLERERQRERHREKERGIERVAERQTQEGNTS